MVNRSEIDKAIGNIMKWAERPEWSEELAAVFEAHLAPVCEQTDVSQEELGEELSEHGCWEMLFGMIFEDFLCRRLPPDDKNVIDDYLARHGWRESIPGRRYLQQLRDTVLSLYEVVEVAQGRHCDIIDLVRGGKTIRVHENMGTQNLFKWDRIAARVLNSKAKLRFSGGILPFTHEASQSLLKVLMESRKQFKKILAQVAGEEEVAKIVSAENLDQRFLHDACPAFTSIWIVHTLEQLHAPLPEMVNRDDEALLFAETRYPFLAEKLEDIAERLDATPEWERDNADHSWIWLPEPDAAGHKPQRGTAIDTLPNGLRPISGTLKLKPGVLTLSSNSLERTERAKGVLEALLQGLIGPAMSMLQTPEQMMAGSETRQQGGGHHEPGDAIDPETAAEIIRNMLDQHYRQCLDEPVPLLDNKSPRQCVKSKKGRAMVIEWLKHLENNELRRASHQQQEPYDSSWMWDELKLTQYRDR